ncbi:MAG: DUF342 domain-containing protein [Dolichospermum sp. LBC05a]|jgi:hypothetical protein|nr:hypothetical protein [Dolichospermum sp. OL01]MCO5797560.1 hypothetical protein [Dolichospermum sp. OL03]MCS6283629.1 hypothetical protein [Dolichospermum sp.]QSV59077.1 MAG: DUF342 domain-containing protein [Dolichospermum sp. LBC05a]
MERRKILIATKTYPSISMKYEEVVCTAGILLDDDEQPLQWIRIYPIRFRSLEIDKHYRRWSIISAEIEKNSKDNREESFRINDDSITIIREIDTKNNWQERKSFILLDNLRFQSIEDIKKSKKSLGIIKPKHINKYYYKDDEREWNEKQQALQNQLNLFKKPLELEKIPYKFYYNFVSENGTNHNFSIIDWEIQQLYRKSRNASTKMTQQEREREALEKVRQKLEDEFISQKDLYFIVGNQQIHPNSFMIIGIFYPPKVNFKQLSLF